MNKGQKFSEELTLEEMQYVAEQISTNEANKEAVKMTLKYLDKEGEAPTQEIINAFKDVTKKDWLKSGNRKFFEVLKDELKDIPLDVYVNITQKQKDMSKTADSITNILTRVMANPQAFSQIPGIGKTFNELLENAGLSPVDFTQITQAPVQQPQQVQQPQTINQ